MSISDIKEIQEINKKILVEFMRLCDDNNIKYFALGGTLLGAVRHEGFIPWDDDIDIGLLREDYDKFIKLSINMPGNYLIESPELCTDSRYFFSKIYDKNTTAIEDMAKPIVKGLWIDVFPLDKTFNSKIMRKLHFFVIKFLARLFSVKKGNYSPYKVSKIKYVVMKIIEVISSIFPQKIINKIYNKTLRCRNMDNSSNYLVNFLGRWGEKEIVPISFFKESTKLNFEDIKISVPLEYAEYLKSIYGDYMTLPPEKDRVGHSLKYLNLRKGWSEEI